MLNKLLQVKIIPILAIVSKSLLKIYAIALLGMLIGKKSRSLQLVGASMMTGHQVWEWVD